MPIDRVFETPVPYARLRLDPFRHLPPETWSEELYRANALIDAVVSARCLDVLDRLGIPREPGGTPATDLALVARIKPERQHAFFWMLERLRASGMLFGDPERAIEALTPGPWTRAALEQAVGSEEPFLGTTFRLVDRVAEQYPAYLRGERDGASILFTRDALALWEGYFHNSNRSYRAVNAMGAAVVDAETSGQWVSVLEVGGGCGSGAELLLERLRSRVGSYLFTEVAPVFLSVGKRRLLDGFPEAPLSFCRLDLDRPLAEQGVKVASFDVAYAVNTLHAVHDLSFSLRELKTALRAGGCLVLAEAVRPTPDFPVAIEFVFLVTREFASCRLEPTYRKRGGFLHHAEWMRALEAAGFDDIRLVPDMDAAIRTFPTYSVACVVGRA